MAHFAKLGVNGKIIAVHSLNNDKLLNADNLEDETVGQQELERIHGWPAALWIQTSYNTRGNKYYNIDGTEGDQSKAFRGNYAGIGFTWDENNQIFWPKKPFDSWTKNLSTASWDAPIPYPSSTVDETSTEFKAIYWNENDFQADNTRGWKAKNFSNDIYSWNGSAWSAD